MISMRVCRYQSLVVDRLRSGVERLEFDSIRARLVVFRSIETKLEVVETIKATEALQDLIEEAKLRTVYWALCIFAVSYFLTHLWYSEITPDKEVPELIRAVIMDALGEVSGRVKEINLVDLVTRDIVDLVGDHIDLFRRNQAAIGVDVMGTLSSEERDERLKHHLIDSKELHPALISPECEYKVLKQIIGGLLAVLLRPQEAQCPLVRCLARELVTCLVMLPIMDFASPWYVNELIECILLAIKD
ncbi:hypothetical protein CsSME_00009504 [Camellia sinensis var. sinensis]